MKRIRREHFRRFLKIVPLVLICLALILLARYVSCINISLEEEILVLKVRGRGPGRGFIGFYCLCNGSGVEAKVVEVKQANGEYRIKLAVKAEPNAEGTYRVEVYGICPDGSTEKVGETHFTITPKNERLEKTPQEGGLGKKKPQHINLRGPPPVGIPIFKVKGAKFTRYLRNLVGYLYTYGTGYWEVETERGLKYFSYMIEIPGHMLNFQIVSDSLEIENIAYPDLILTSKYVSAIRIVEGEVSRLEYYPSTITASLYGNVSRYGLSVYHYAIPEEELRKHPAKSPRPEYLQVPEKLAPRLRSLALSLTSDCPTDYDKVKKLVEFLRGNYRYDPTVETPADKDPVEYFLFESKKGVCRHFNSALALLLRSIGIPARVVSGFVVPPGPGERIVTDKERHLWVEVYFEDIGWVSFDATPSAPQHCMCECGGGGSSSGRAGGRGGQSKTRESSAHAGSRSKTGKTGAREEERLKLVLRPNPLVLRPGGVGGVVGILYSEQGVAAVFTSPSGDVSVELREKRGNSFKLRVRVGEIPGEYSVFVTATDPRGRKGSAVLRVIVTGSFAIKADRDRVELIRGEEAEINLSVVPVGAYLYRVLLAPSASNLKVDVEPKRGRPPFNATLSIRSSVKNEPGAYRVLVQGVGEDGTQYNLWLPVIVKARTKVIVTKVEPEIIKKGSSMLVEGVLTTDLGEPLSDRKIEVYLSINKSLEDAVKICTAKTAEDGSFRANCTIPTTLEVGNYQVIARFPGDEFFVNSTSDPVVKVVSEPQIVAEIPSIALVGRVYEVKGKVSDVDGKGIENLLLLVYVNNTKICEVVSGSQGTFTFNLSFEMYGNWVVRLVHPGSEYYLRSEAKVVTRALKVTLDIPEFFVRGVEGNVTGRVYGLRREDFELTGINITVEAHKGPTRLENTSRLTDPSFSVPLLFGWPFGVGDYEIRVWLKLGDHVVLVSKSVIPLKAATRLLVEVPGEVAPGDTIRLVVRLVDAHYENLSIGGVPVSIDGKLVTLNSTGVAVVYYKVPSDYENDALKLRVVFSGSEYLLPSSREVEIRIRKSIPWLLAVPIVAAVSVASYAYYAKRKKMVETTGPVLVSRVMPRSPYRIEISFPGLEPPLPPLWAPGETVRVAIRVYEDSMLINVPVKVYVDGKFLGESPEFDYVFSKEGTHVIEARAKVNGKAVRGRVTLRIARYDVEVQRLYNEVFLSWIKDYINDIEEKTPAEILLEFYSNPSLIELFPVESLDKKEFFKNIETITRIFEEAKYSLHPITREKFVSFYLSLYALGLPVGEAYEE